ncbi:DGQHR domain-containing protein [Tenacibaculum mesophilum]|uniref:DGQHR domain-containing protein n=1 Tax=Tenacibaculum mesophilum TaxID=104268 RepID=UPI003F60B37A
MKVPYIRIRQRGEVFYSSKFKVNDLLEHIDFHFREPYEEYQTDDVNIKNEKYIDLIKRKGIELESNEEGIQRRLQYERIKSIANFIESSESNFFPNNVLLSADISHLENFEEDYLNYENSEIGVFEFPDNFKFSIIDGQHRLAGLTLADKALLEDFEIPATILINVSKPTAAKLFADINGKQKSVNKSLIYDLYSEMDDEDYRDIKVFHTICENLYTNPESPLYKQIKMLGIGSGAISQAFFIDYAKDAVNKTDLKNAEIQEIYNELYKYFKAYQKTFPNDWPVPESFKSNKELEEHSDVVLKINKSQLVKTNGFGAILRVFPTIYKKSDKSFKSYLNIIEKLKDNIEWTKTEVTGTGKAFQNKIVNQILEIIN